MAERLADVVTQIHNVRQLEAVVTAMRGIAASRAQQSRSLLAGIEAYTDVISRTIGRALSLLPPDFATTSLRRRAKRGLILFCAEQGFAGAFSERVLDAAVNDIGDATSLIVGTRGVGIAHERGIKPVWSAPMAAHVDAIPGLPTGLVTPCMATSRAAPSPRSTLLPRWVSGSGIQIDRHRCSRSTFNVLHNRRAAGPPDNAPSSAIARSPCSGIPLRAALRSGHARLRSGE